MSFPGYPSYQDSGVEWLGEVPSHWVFPKIKHIASFKGGSTPSRNNPTFWNGDIPWVSPKDMKAEVVNGSEERITEDGLSQMAGGLIAPDAVLMVVRSGILRHTVPVAINSVTVALNQDMKALRFNPSRCVPHFFFRWVQGLNNSLVMAWMKQGATVESLEHQYLAETILPLPPLNEQVAIVAFLDRETAKIDALIGEQQRLITLLKEKRKAVTSHAVTKGLNKYAPMKDSGIDWLGDVPAHWSIAKFSRVIDFQEGPGIMAADFQDQGVPLIRVAGASGRWASLNGCNYLDPKKVAARWNHFRLKLGDLIISGSASMGAVSEIGTETVGAIPYTGLIRLQPVETETTRDFVRAIVGSSMFLTQTDLLKAGATIQHFGPSHLRRMIVPVPPLTEQRAIASHIESLNAQYVGLSDQAEQAIKLLEERRAALISAAITGKIDVRGSAEVLAFPIHQARARALVAIEIIERLAHQATFGRVKLQKIAFLTEAHVGVTELAGSYTREAAGPLDRAMIVEMESSARCIAGVVVDQSGGTGTAVTYRLGRHRGAHRKELADWLGPDRTAKLDKLIADFAGLSTKGAEAVATLYGIWNDALIEGISTTDEDIISGFLGDWHPEKREKFRADELRDWLAWMRRHGTLPTGSSPKTTIGRLFA